jgi:hypothetical protein
MSNWSGKESGTGLQARKFSSIWKQPWNDSNLALDDGDSRARSILSAYLHWAVCHERSQITAAVTIREMKERPSG